jgi:tRNA G37 N-methylase Trm5
MKRRVICTAAIVLGLTGLVVWQPWTSASTGAAEDKTPDVVYVPTPNDVVAEMLKVAKVKKTDVVYDLGCGDGRIVVTAAKKYGAKGIGFDIDPQRLKESRANVKKNGVEKLVEIKDQNIFKTDLSKASVITLYLLPSLNKKLVPQLQKMKPGSRVVSHEYDIAGYKPDKTIHMKSREDGAEHTIYLWTIPLKKEKEKE